MRTSWSHLSPTASVPAGSTTGVSLHSHTMHSRENMAFLPRHAMRIPVVAGIIARHERNFARTMGRELDYNRAWWTPPLPPADAFRLEAAQIERLGLRPLVSLTDHDSIDSGRELHLLEIAAPISVEWTVPFGNSFLHIGVHNLPPADAPDWMRLFALWTARPRPAVLGDILAGLHAIPGVLTVFNHPLWDEGGIGRHAQCALAETFLHRYRSFVHAVELNGLRPHAENALVLRLAESFSLPAISGGDRHGCEPNGNINLTRAASFAEFVSEIRDDAQSEILFLPQYREPHKLRCAETIWDALRDYPEYPGRILWSDRIHFIDDSGDARSLTELWKGSGPGIVRNFVALMRVFNHRSVRGALRAVLAERPPESAA